MGRPTFRAGKRMFAVFAGDVETSYRQVALNRMIEALDQRDA
jgi:hypothetical protein